MSTLRHKSMPLPAAVLALSVAVCLGAAGPVEAASSRASLQADQRETIEHLLGAIQLAAKKLSDQLTGQVASFDRASDVPVHEANDICAASMGRQKPTLAFLRDALLNLPPPSC